MDARYPGDRKRQREQSLDPSALSLKRGYNTEVEPSLTVYKVLLSRIVSRWPAVVKFRVFVRQKLIRQQIVYRVHRTVSRRLFTPCVSPMLRDEKRANPFRVGGIELVDMHCFPIAMEAVMSARKESTLEGR